MATNNKEALKLGILESIISCSFVIKKCQIQAGNVHVIPKPYVIGYLSTNTIGHILSYQNEPIKLLSASFMSVFVESITRNCFSSTKPNIIASSFIFGRELCFWSGIGTTNYFLREENSQVKGFLAHFLFSGIIGNIFDTLAGISFRKKINITDFRNVYRTSIFHRLTSAVIIPNFVVNMWFIMPK